MTMRRYRLSLFKITPGTGSVYGAKHVEGMLDCLCDRLIHQFGPNANVYVIGPGHYLIRGGLAELRVL